VPLPPSVHRSATATNHQGTHWSLTSLLPCFRQSSRMPRLLGVRRLRPPGTIRCPMPIFPPESLRSSPAGESNPSFASMRMWWLPMQVVVQASLRICDSPLVYPGSSARMAWYMSQLPVNHPHCMHGRAGSPPSRHTRAPHYTYGQGTITSPPRKHSHSCAPSAYIPSLKEKKDSALNLVCSGYLTVRIR